MWVNERASRAIKLVLNCEYLQILPAKYLFDKMVRAKKKPLDSPVNFRIGIRKSHCFIACATMRVTK